MQRLILKRIRKKSEMPSEEYIGITQITVNDMTFSFYIDKDDRYFFEGNNKIYEVINKVD